MTHPDYLSGPIPHQADDLPDSGGDLFSAPPPSRDLREMMEALVVFPDSVASPTEEVRRRVLKFPTLSSR